MDEKNEDKDKWHEKIRKKRGVNASDHSGWSSENSPWGGGSSSGRGTGPEGRGDGGGHSSRRGQKVQTKREKEAKEKLEAEEKAKREAEEKTKKEAIIAKEQRARTALKQTSSLAIIGGALTPTGQMAPVFSASGVGSMALTDAIGTSLLAEFSGAINSLNTVVTTASNIAFNALSRGFVVASIFHSPEVGKGSDLAHGRTLEQFLSLSVPAKTMGLTNHDALKQAAKTSSGIDMSVRGKLAVTEKKVDINVVKTQKSQSVRVVEAKFDKNTGLYSHAILDNKIGDINVVTAPIKESVLTGQPPLVTSLPTVPVNIPNRGNSSESANSSPMPVSKTTPFHDVIIVYPESAKMEPVYVIFEPKAQSIAEAASQYHAEPLTEKITEHKGLVRIKSRTPSKTGEGMKGRWLSAVDGAIYEWNSEVGKLEVVKSPHKPAEQSIKEAGKNHYPTPLTESLTDYQGLLESRAKTPVADGKGKKFRWTDATGKKLYEWNPLIGKMETYKVGHWDTEINRKGESVRVWVVESVIDQATGLYGITLPDEHGKQGRTMLISPIKAPGADGLGHLLHPEERQIVILNTGENAAIKTPIVTVYPNPVQPDIDAQIAIPPLETNYKPLYVMFNKPRKGEKPAGHDYHQPPKTQDITGFFGLIERNPKTPKQGGSGERRRWIDSKRRTIYEWDYQHGELEGYRASDGEHLGSFDHKTGQKIKPAVPGRNIKKYL